MGGTRRRASAKSAHHLHELLPQLHDVRVDAEWLANVCSEKTTSLPSTGAITPQPRKGARTRKGASTAVQTRHAKKAMASKAKQLAFQAYRDNKGKCD